MTPAQAAAFVDSLTDEAITKLVSELMWYQITLRAPLAVPPTNAIVRDVQLIMQNRAREKLIDRLVTP